MPAATLRIKPARSMSLWLTVSASPEVLLELPPSLAEGSSISARVRLPAVLTTNLTVNLESSWPARLPVPPTVEIPAGATEVSLILTVPNDERLQGVQSVSLFVQANGFFEEHANEERN